MAIYEQENLNGSNIVYINHPTKFRRYFSRLLYKESVFGGGYLLTVLSDSNIQQNKRYSDSPVSVTRNNTKRLESLLTVHDAEVS